MSLLVPWFIFPLIAGLASWGWAVIVERVSGVRAPGALQLPLGMAAIVVVSQLTVWTRFLAPLTTLIVAAGAIAGLGIAWRFHHWGRPDWWAVAVGLGVFGLYAAPIVLSGEASFTGYTILGDTAIHLELVDRLMTEGATVAGMEPSSVSASLNSYFLTSYPTGAHTALGALYPLALTNVAWAYQPFLACLAAGAALPFYVLARTVVSERPLAAAAGALAPASGLMYGYALQGAIKELATVWLLVLLVALLPTLLSEPATARRAVPLAVVVAAAAAVIDVAVAAWVLPVLVAVLGVLAWRARRDGWTPFVLSVAAFVAVTTLLALPTLVDVLDFKAAAEGVLAAQEEFGNLLRPIGFDQALGVWNTGDFRLPLGPGALWVGMAQGAIALFGVMGVIWLCVRRGWAPLLLIAISLLGCWYVAGRGSPWADGKALMILSPVLVFAALLGAASLRPLSAWQSYGALMAIAAAVLATDAIAYHDVSRAPHARMQELERVGERFAGQGPTLYTEFEEFNKHFLYDMAPTGTQESYQPFPSEVNEGRFVRFGFSADLDDFQLGYVTRFRTLVVRRGPLASRPPSNYARVFRGRYVDVWQQRAEPEVLEHLPLGGRGDRGATASCDDLRRLAARAARDDARLATVRAPRLPTYDPTREIPRNWALAADDDQTLRPLGPGRSQGRVWFDSADRYLVWAEGSFGRPVAVFVDGRRVGTAAYELSPRATSVQVGDARISSGFADVMIERGGGSLRPENGGLNRLVGPVRFEPVELDERRVEEVEPADVRSLCGQRLDWVEVVR